MRVYLDNCSLNRPFDDQTQPRIRTEAEAKLEIQRRIHAGTLELAWSYLTDFENQFNPFQERREAISRWRSVATIDIDGNDNVLATAQASLKLGLRAKDALHLACAIEAKCDYFITTDDILLKKAAGLARIRAVNPMQFIAEVSS